MGCCVFLLVKGFPAVSTLPYDFIMMLAISAASYVLISWCGVRCLFPEYLSRMGIPHLSFWMREVYPCVAAIWPKTWYRWCLFRVYLQIRHFHCCISRSYIAFSLNIHISDLGIPYPYGVRLSITPGFPFLLEPERSHIQKLASSTTLQSNIYFPIAQ